MGLLLPTVAGTQMLPQAVSSPEAEPEPPTEAIEAEPSEGESDDGIQSRINSIFDNLQSLRLVSADVSDGVVVLEGTVDDIESRDLAETLAGRVTGTVIIVNNIVRDRSIAARVQAAAQDLEGRLKELVGMTPVLLLSLVMIAITFLIARVAGRADRLYGRLSKNWFVRDLLRQMVQVAIVVAGIVVALQLLDASAMLGSVVGALGILGLAIGFATRDTVENYIASILLSIRQPFRREDHILIDEVEGKVLRLTPRATVLLSLDGNHVRIPNATVFKATIVNYTLNPLRRFEFRVGVGTNIDLREARTLAVDALRRTQGILETPEPICHIVELGDSSVVLAVQAWLDQRESDFHKLRSKAQRIVKEAFDHAGIVMPEPIYNVNLRRKSVETRHAAADSGPSPESSQVDDTAPDRTVDRQIRAEHRAGDDPPDLLSEGAARE
jgi:small-conductance mechanosensitive channel